MANKQAIYTFHQVREKCPQGDAGSWRGFFNLYGALGLQLLEIYAASDSAAWDRTLGALTQNNFERLRAMPQQSEREFLMDLRAQILEHASGGPGGNEAAEAGAARFNLERIATVVDGLPLLHQEIVWFTMAGYTEATIERMLRMTPTVARSAMERLTTAFGPTEPQAVDRCPYPRDWLALLGRARTEKKEDCPTMHQLLRIHDGQVTWYDKEPVEKRVSTCRHCLDNWTGLREVAHWRQAAPPISADRVERWLAHVPVTEPKKKSLFQRTS